MLKGLMVAKSVDRTLYVVKLGNYHDNHISIHSTIIHTLKYTAVYFHAFDL